MQLQGTIKKIGDLQTFTSGFQKRDMVLLTEEQYPQPINIEFLSDSSDLIDPYKEGDSIKVSINIRGREWTSPQGEIKYFNSITGWRIEKLEGSAPAEPSGKVKPATPHEAFGHAKTESAGVFQEDMEDSELPF